jgi:DNA polymerase III subunit delta'
MPWSVIGHEWAVEMLQRDVAQDRARHAYLFTGPAGIGKRTLVGDFARALLCQAADPPCGQCRHCQLAARGRHPDLLTVEPVMSGKSVRTAKIKIESVRQVIHDLSLKPVEARRRVARLLRFETANSESMNAFLKTLEEPPGRTVILVTAERADDLLPTIVSRCAVVPLRPLALETVRTALITNWLVPAERADLLAHLSQGRLGWAVRMQADEAALAARQQALDDLSALLSASRVARFAYAERLAKETSSDRIQETLDLWQSLWRDVLLAGAASASAGAGTPGPLANPDREAEVRRLAEAVPPAAAREVMLGLRRTAGMLEQNANARLALEVCLLDWPRLAGDGRG